MNLYPNEKKEPYFAPEMEAIRFETKDIITTLVETEGGSYYNIMVTI